MVLSVGEGELLPEGDWPEVGGDTGLASPAEGAGEEVGVGVGGGVAVVVEGAGVGAAVGGETGMGVGGAGAGAGVAAPAETCIQGDSSRAVGDDGNGVGGGAGTVRRLRHFSDVMESGCEVKEKNIADAEGLT
ncbi:hypothetical protein L1887_03103 [Cichorium endivia]|nr:hypothetical protein L1887_03103 [Cichorium endivia]